MVTTVVSFLLDTSCCIIRERMILVSSLDLLAYGVEDMKGKTAISITCWHSHSHYCSDKYDATS